MQGQSLESLISLYRRHGFSIIPVLPLDKKAAVPWSEYQARKPTDEEVSVWFEKYWSKGYNVAVVCGDVSNNLVVVDVDVYSSPDSAKIFDLDKTCKETAVVETPSGGYHIYFFSKHPVPSFNLVYQAKPVLEVRSIGRYVLAPPSIAVDKRTGQPKPYRFLSSPERIALVDFDPQLLARKAGEKLGLNVTLPIAYEGDKLIDLYRTLQGKPYRGRHPPCIQFILAGVPQGMRNEACIRLASYLVHLRKLNPKKVVRLLLEWNARNKPPLPEKEIYNVVKSLANHGYSYGCRSLRAFGCRFSTCHVNLMRRKPIKPLTDTVFF
jgi:hypothetical protein